MKRPSLASIDLNLLVVLDVLLESGSTVKAARRLGCTQSTVSHALSRLRDQIGDPLFVRTGNELSATSVARSMREPLRALLTSAEQLVFGALPFDPETLSRPVMLASTDIAETVVLPRLIPLLRRRAPTLDVVTTNTSDVNRALHDGAIDLALGLMGRSGAGVIDQPLFEDRYVAVLRTDHPAAGDRLSIDDLVRLDHILIAPSGQPGSFLDTALAERGKQRRVVLQSPNPSSAVLLVARTELCVVAPARLVRALSEILSAPLRLVELPFELPCFKFGCRYSATRERDPLVIWLRGLLVEASVEPR